MRSFYTKPMNTKARFCGVSPSSISEDTAHFAAEIASWAELNSLYREREEMSTRLGEALEKIGIALLKSEAELGATFGKMARESLLTEITELRKMEGEICAEIAKLDGERQIFENPEANRDIERMVIAWRESTN